MKSPELPHPRNRECLDALLGAHLLGRCKLAGYLREGQVSLQRCWVDDAAEPRGIIMEHRSRYTVLADDDAAMRRILGAIDWSNEVRFSAFPHEFLALLHSLATVLDSTNAFLYNVERRDFTPQIASPVRALTKRDAAQVTAAWDYGNDLDYCRQRIAAAPSSGTDVDGELAAFIITHSDTAMGILHTRPELRRRGLARTVTSALAAEVLDRGLHAYCFIVDGNVASMRLFESLGFRRRLACSWLVAAGSSRRSSLKREGT